MINLISHWKSSHYTQIFNICNCRDVYSEKFHNLEFLFKIFLRKHLRFY